MPSPHTHTAEQATQPASPHPERLEIPGQPGIYLQLVTEADAPTLVQLYIDNLGFLSKHNYGWTSESPLAIQEKVAQKIQALKTGEELEYLIKDSSQGQAIGVVGFYDLDMVRKQGAISYMVDERHSGHGYAKAAAVRMKEYRTQSLGLRKVIVELDPSNEPSKSIAKALGAHPVGDIHDIYFVEEAGKQFPVQKWEADFEQTN